MFASVTGLPIGSAVGLIICVNFFGEGFGVDDGRSVGVGFFVGVGVLAGDGFTRPVGEGDDVGDTVSVGERDGVSVCVRFGLGKMIRVGKRVGIGEEEPGVCGILLFLRRKKINPGTATRIIRKKKNGKTQFFVLF